MQELVIVFVKAPRAGMVKTRLALSIGAEQACAVYRELVEAVLGRLRERSQVQLRYCPDDAWTEISVWLKPGWQAMPQGSGELGERLHRAFEESFAAGAERVLLLGSDCVEFDEADLQEALAGLADHDVALGPAFDGGYWLIGLRAPAPKLFQNVNWSTPTVFRETLDRAHTAGLSVRLLRKLNDIDVADDLRRWRREKPPSLS